MLTNPYKIYVRKYTSTGVPFILRFRVLGRCKKYFWQEKFLVWIIQCYYFFVTWYHSGFSDLESNFSTICIRPPWGEKYYDEEVSSHMLSWEIFMFIHNSCVPKELRIWLIYEHEELGTYKLTKEAISTFITMFAFLRLLP